MGFTTFTREQRNDMRLFQFDSGIAASLAGSSLNSPNYIEFEEEFEVPPVVTLTQVGDVYKETSVKEVTTEGFYAYSDDATSSTSWTAATAGIYDLGDGVIIQSGYGSSEMSSEGVHIPVYQVDKTPSVHAGNTRSNNRLEAEPFYVVGPRSTGGGETTNLNHAGRSRLITLMTPNVAGNLAAYFIITQTSTVQTGTPATADGAKKKIGDKDFEAGTVYKANSTTPELNFSSNFSSIPTVLLTGETRREVTSTSDTEDFEGHYQTATVAAITAIVLGSTDEWGGYNWFAVDPGFTSKRVPRLD